MIIRIILLIILVTLLGISLFYLYDAVYNMNAVPISFLINQTPVLEDFSGNLQFYPNMRFPEKQISYNIDSECDSGKENNVIESFNILSNKTGLLSFAKADGVNNAEISISCQNAEIKAKLRDKYYIAGEGGPTKIINTSFFYVIKQGEILLTYINSGCDYPVVELHELLHVLGFDHSSNPESIMYPTSSCSQRITQDITTELKRLYSIPEFPDLYFLNVSATKHGRYLDFSVNIRNRGLNLAKNITINLFSKDSLITQYNLGDIDYGEGKFLNVTNIRVGNINSLKFILVDGEDLNQGDNTIYLTLAG